MKPTEVMKLSIDKFKPEVNIPTFEQIQKAWPIKQHGLK